MKLALPGAAVRLTTRHRPARVLGAGARSQELSGGEDAAGYRSYCGFALAAHALLFRHPGGRLAAHDVYALRTFTDFYLSRPALVAALVGIGLVARAAFWRDPALFLTDRSDWRGRLRRDARSNDPGGTRTSPVERPTSGDKTLFGYGPWLADWTSDV